MSKTLCSPTLSIEPRVGRWWATNNDASRQNIDVCDSYQIKFLTSVQTLSLAPTLFISSFLILNRIIPALNVALKKVVLVRLLLFLRIGLTALLTLTLTNPNFSPGADLTITISLILSLTFIPTLIALDAPDAFYPHPSKIRLIKTHPAL